MAPMTAEAGVLTSAQGAGGHRAERGERPQAGVWPGGETVPRNARRRGRALLCAAAAAAAAARRESYASIIRYVCGAELKLCLAVVVALARTVLLR